MPPWPQANCYLWLEYNQALPYAMVTASKYGRAQHQFQIHSGRVLPLKHTSFAGHACPILEFIFVITPENYSLRR